MDKILFNKTCKQVLATAIDKNGVIGESSHIGLLSEKTVHAVVKKYIEPNPKNHEVKIEGFYADIINDKGVIEVQNRNFNQLRRKLNILLDLQPLTIVYPIAHIKMIHWIDDETGEINKPRKSTITGTPYLIFRELYRIKGFLNHPNLNFHLLLMDMDEYRLLDGWSKDKKSGATKCDRIPTKLVNEVKLESLDDYIQLIPSDLESPFTVKDFRKAAKIQLKDAQYTVHILNHLGAINKIGNKGRAYLYSY